MNTMTYTVHIERAKEGGYVAFFPALPGCHSQGETVEEVIAMAKDALTGYMECLRAHGEPIPVEKSASKPNAYKELTLGGVKGLRSEPTYQVNS